MINHTINKDGFIYVKSTPEIHAIAVKRFKNDGVFRGSITNGTRSIAAYEAEEIACRLFGGVMKNTPDYDFVLPSGDTVDVKIKVSNQCPKPSYACTVTNINQKPDYFFFGYGVINRMTKEVSDFYFAGLMSKADFDLKCTVIPAGTTFENGTTFEQTNWNISADMVL